MPLAEAYEAIASRLIDLAEDLTVADANTVVPASPAWTVKDVYSHLAGAAADVAGGTAEGIGTEPWTAAHVSERSRQTIEEACTEWVAHVPELLALIERTGDTWLAIVAGTWIHEQDIRAAVGLHPLVSGRGLDAVLMRVEEATERLAAAAAPALRIVTPDRQWVLGAGEGAATLTVSSFELARVISSRRTIDQIAALDWDGDSTPYVHALGMFGPGNEPLSV